MVGIFGYVRVAVSYGRQTSAMVIPAGRRRCPGTGANVQGDKSLTLRPEIAEEDEAVTHLLLI